jgi:hypothetical protein
MWKEVAQCLLLSTHQLWHQAKWMPTPNCTCKSNLEIWRHFFSLLVKRTSSSCSITKRLDNRILPFLQHKEHCGLLVLDFVNRSLIHIFTLQNPHIMSIFPQSHHAGVDASSFVNNWNASLPREGCAHVVAYCTIHRSRCKRLFRSCGILDGLADSIRYLARRSLCRRL